MKVCEVRIFGQTYSLRTDEDERELVRVAELVDRRMTEVAKAAPSASALQVAVLAALDLAGEIPDKPQAEVVTELAAAFDQRVEAMLKVIDTVSAEHELA